MKNDIVEKLDRILQAKSFYEQSSVSNEARVVYLLSEVRKIFELDKSLDEQFSTLQFYCNWALHIVLDRKSAQSFLNKILPVLTLNGNHTEEQHKALGNLLTLQSLREELTRFLSDHGLVTALWGDTLYWSGFLDAYSNVVKGSALMLKGNAAPSGPLNLTVRSVTVRSVAGLELVNHRPLPMIWHTKYADGRTSELSLSAEGLSGAILTLSGPPYLPV